MVPNLWITCMAWKLIHWKFGCDGKQYGWFGINGCAKDMDGINGMD